MRALGRPFLSRAGIAPMDMEFYVLATPGPVEPRPKSPQSLGYSKVSCPRRPMDQLEDPGPQMLRHQELEDLTVTPGSLPAAIEEAVSACEVGPLGVESLGLEVQCRYFWP